MLRIIQIVENLDKGAVENWLVHVFLESRKTRPGWEWTFYCILGKPGRLDEKVREAGGTIVYSPYWISEKVPFLKNLRQTLKKNRYDIIHAHHDYLSGFYLLATAGISFKKRILHIHNTDKVLPVGSARLQKVLLKIFERSAIYFSDIIVGISKDTLAEFTRNKRFKRKQTKVLYYGIDLTPFRANTGKEWLTDELSVPGPSKIILFIGRMTALKNPVFVIDILKALLVNRQDIYAVFVGKGEQEEAVIKRAEDCGVTGRIKMLGWRNDGPAILQASDVFVFPRVEYPKEGLGLVVVEAQAAGTPMLLSRGIVEDAIEIKELANIVSLDNNAEEWATAINTILNQPPVIERQQAYQRMQQSKFALSKATGNLVELYTSY